MEFFNYFLLSIKILTLFQGEKGLLGVVIFSHFGERFVSKILTLFQGEILTLFQGEKGVGGYI